MFRRFTYLALACLPLGLLQATDSPQQNNKQENPKTTQPVKIAPTKIFTGKVVGKNVRMRTLPDIESHIVMELGKSELLVIDGEKNDFYAIVPPLKTKAFVFRSFILDNVVEGNRVNVRLSPDLEAPIIGHLTNGQHIEGSICEKNHKWLEIDAPNETRFYIAKEYIEYLGGPELKAAHDKRKSTVSQLMDSAELISQSEFRKPFEEINLEKLTRNYHSVINDYSDFPELVEKAKAGLSSVNENYLHKKLAFLEAKASRLGQRVSNNEARIPLPEQNSSDSTISPTDRMKIWEPIEEAIYLTWAALHHSKTIVDFYSDQKLQALNLSGILEAYPDPVQNKPGDFIVKEKDLPVGYVYSTHLDLESYVGKHVKLLVTQRPNNNFAFPAYYVIGTE